MAEEEKAPQTPTKRVSRGDFREAGVPGLDFTYGFIQADPDFKLQGQKGIEQYDLMRYTDPTVSAVLMALSLPVREASWTISPASSQPADVEAAEFVESCLHDMSFSWDDILTEVCTMFPFGWAFMEWVLKPRLGPNPPRNLPVSQHSDGRIGFKKMALRGQASLHRWDMDDDTGKLGGMYQWAATGVLHIPLAKSILFRTTKELNNPEGFSLLRPAYRAWSYKRNIERFEAIGIQRAMQGLPVVKLLQGATRAGTTTTGESTEERATGIIQRLYDNTMLGVIEDADMEFRFEAPDLRGISQDSGRVILRYDESIARAALAMYILLGAREQGSYALSRELGDLFFLAVEGFINMISQTFSRYGIPALFRYNAFPGITGLPEITTSINRRVDLEALAKFINDTVGAMVITPDEELERYVRELADFPPPAITVGQEQETITPAAEESSEETVGAPSEEGQEAESASRGRVETFARGTDPYASPTDAYQAGLRQDYEDWVKDVGAELKKSKPADNLAEKWAILVALGLLMMKKKGWEHLPEAFALGYGSSALSPGARQALEAELLANDGYLSEKLWPKIGKALSPYQLEEIARLYWAGKDEEANDLLYGALLAIRGNVGQYAGGFWRSIWVASVVRAEEGMEIVPIQWVLDALAEHCRTCLVFGNREYANMEDLVSTTGGVLPGQGTECAGNCRCGLKALRGGVWVLL